jgi:hypothetical protein
MVLTRSCKLRIAIVRDGVVENVILADEDYEPEDGVLAVPAGTCGPGWTYNGETFIPPQEPSVEATDI